MKAIALQTFVRDGVTRDRGEVFEVEDRTAAEWIAAGLIEEAPEDEYSEEEDV